MPKGECVFPVPADAPAPTFRHPEFGEPVEVYPYRGADDALLGHVARYEPAGQRKQFVPWTLWREGGRLRWRMKHWPSPRPLYGLDRLAASPSASVVVVEGEKCADAARAVFPRSVVVTSPGGSNAPHKADWSPLEGRKVLIWPDADEAGAKYARVVAEILGEVGVAELRTVDAFALASRTVLDEPRDPPEGWDAADALEEGWQPAALRKAVVGLASKPDERAAFVSFDHYTMDGGGLWVEVTKGKGENAKQDTAWVCSPFEVLGRARDPGGHGWAKWLRWSDPDGRRHEHAVSDAAIHGDLGVLASDLAGRGLTIARAGRPHLADYLNRVDVRKRVTTVPRTGWHVVGDHRVFVLPDEVIGAVTAESVILSGASAAPYASRGSLEDWRQSVGRLAAGHSRLVLAISTALAGSLLGIVGVEGGGINIHGPSSKGKTTCLRAAASVWGRGASDPGFVQSWRSTANATEAVASLMSDTLLCLDEIGVAEGRDAAAAVYQLSTGVGKGRSARDGTLRSRMTWRVMTLSTGEIPMAAKVAEDRNRRAMAGQAVRLLDIPADAGRGFGAFDHAGQDGDPRKLAEAIGEAAVTFYGTAGPAFVRRIAEESGDTLACLVAEMVARFQAQHVPAGADGQVARAAARLGLIAAAGELATAWGITPWVEGEAKAAAAKALGDWIASRGGTDPAEVREALRQVQRFFEAHGEARFETIDGDGEARPVINRVGWRKGSGSERTWFVLPELWKSEICSGLDPSMVGRTLVDAGMLKTDPAGKFSRAERTPYGNKRVYVVTAAVLEGGE
jgi:uncharacterized protein (DUF927 family)/5S rRNA maturation endonuclease (ribonuclease M5)